jgi:hypothetical protein
MGERHRFIFYWETVEPAARKVIYQLEFVMMKDNNDFHVYRPFSNIRFDTTRFS